MSLLFWILFAALVVVDIWMIVKLVQAKNKVLTKGVVSTITPFCIYIILGVIFHFDIPDYIWIIVILAQFIRSYVGYYLDYYERSRIFDRYIHAYGCFAYALLIYATIKNIMETGGSRLFRSGYVFTIGLAIGVVIEIVEFMLDSRDNRDVQLQKGLKDTNMDLVSDTIGSVCAGVVAFFFLV